MICEICNKIMDMIEYSLCGNTDNSNYNNEISLPIAILLLLIGLTWLLIISWWLIPIQYINNKLGLNKITFKCKNKK